MLFIDLFNYGKQRVTNKCNLYSRKNDENRVLLSFYMTFCCRQQRPENENKHNNMIFSSEEVMTVHLNQLLRHA